jgi:hypothetical protein
VKQQKQKPQELFRTRITGTLDGFHCWARWEPDSEEVLQRLCSDSRMVRLWKLTENMKQDSKNLRGRFIPPGVPATVIGENGEVTKRR